ncbi:hypothetical protein BKA69DRAFT_1065030 [Paraphysoderma sedebokerense]|nr:hypothetical protein BKA69DRAFT_1065030 [Paraphysoderma sedebokerense]
MTSDNVPHLSRAGLYNLLDQEFSRIIGKTIAYINPNKYPTGIGDALVKVIESPEYFHLRRNQSKLLQKFRFSEFIYILRDSGTFNRMLIRTILPNTYFLKSYDDQVFTSSYVDEDKVTDNEVSSGVSIFTAIRNRNDIIDITLPTWYNTKGVNEVVIVDWSSDPPLQPIIERHRLKSPVPILLFIIPNRHRWVLSPAFNIAARNTRYDKILKVDGDTLLDSDFVKAHSLPKGGFFAGNWRVSYKHGDLNIRHLNGIAFFHRHHFVNLLNGYDERINTYGWDDDNLYQRARNGGLIRYELNYHKIRHYEHNDNIRSSEECVECETSINRVATKKMPDWGPRFTNSRCLNWRVTEDITPQKFRPKLTTGLAVNLTSVCTDLISHPSSVRDYFTDSQWNRIVKTGYINVLKWRTQIPHTDLNSVRYPTTAKILSQIYSPKRLNHLGYFIIHVQHGLGNRIRSYISAKSIAERTGRKLIVIWEPDVHCFAEFYDIFGAETNETVLKEFNLNWFKEKNFRLFNYFEWEGGTKNELIDANISKDIYVKSSFKLVSVQSKQSAEDQILRSLPYSDMVSAIIKNWLNTHNLTRETIGTYVGVHIRMISNITEDVGNLSPLETKVMKEAVPYRQNCNYSSFITNLSSFPPTTKFFVAIDKTQHIEDLENKFPRRIKYIDRGNCAVDRSVECVQYAMSDLIVLGWTKKVIGSRWSSFSEIARRLNEAGHAITAC